MGNPQNIAGNWDPFFLHDMEDQMTELVRYQCVQCGDKFEVPVLTEKERREAERDRRPVFAIQCPKCGSPYVRKL
jgi:DNA-directed RNA polymerase subunit RPC12/RpoP